MDELENRNPVEPDLAELQRQFDALRHLVVSILVLLVIVSGTFNIYLWRQVRSTKRDLDTWRPYASNLMSGYQKGDGQVVEAFLRNIGDYGRTHPDFAPILNKYNIRMPPATGAAPTTAVPPAPDKAKK